MTDFSSGLSQAVQEGDDKKVVQLVKEALVEGSSEMGLEYPRIFLEIVRCESFSKVEINFLG